jgi:hypothetical protein
MMAEARRNRFANAKTFSELQDMYYSLTSPENLYADGERTQVEAQALSRQLKADYEARDRELQEGLFPNVPQQ